MKLRIEIFFTVLVSIFIICLVGCNINNYDMPPEVKIVLPESNTTVFDSVIVKCLCSDDNSIDKVELWINAEQNDSFICFEAPYEFVLYAKDFERNQRVAISARIYDDEENFSDSDPIYLTMYKIDEKPTVQITYPTEEIDVEDSLIVVCSVSDDSEITKVELLINGSSNSNQIRYEEPYEFTIYAEDYYNTRLQLVAKAYDDAYQYTYSEPVFVNIMGNVDNGEFSDLFDGQYIYMASYSQPNIYRYNFSNAMIEQLTYSDNARYPVYLDNMNKIGYRDYGKNNIYIMDMDGSNQSKFYELPTNCYDLCYSSANSALYFYSIESTRKLGMVDDSGFKYLTNSENYHDLSCDVNSIGNYLAFISDRTGLKQLYLYDLNNNTDERLFETATLLKRPEWSKIHDGIYYMASDESSYTLNYYDINDSTSTEIYRSTYDFNFVLSPDEKFVMLAFLYSPTPDLYIFDIEKSKLERITNTAIDFVDLQWVDLN